MNIIIVALTFMIVVKISVIIGGIGTNMSNRLKKGLITLIILEIISLSICVKCNGIYFDTLELVLGMIIGLVILVLTTIIYNYISIKLKEEKKNESMGKNKGKR